MERKIIKTINCNAPFTNCNCAFYFPLQQDSLNSFDHSTPQQKQSQSIPVYHQPIFEPPPSLITLRPEPPISQVYLKNQISVRISVWNIWSAKWSIQHREFNITKCILYVNALSNESLTHRNDLLLIFMSLCFCACFFFVLVEKIWVRFEIYRWIVAKLSHPIRIKSWRLWQPEWVAGSIFLLASLQNAESAASSRCSEFLLAKYHQIVCIY